MQPQVRFPHLNTVRAKLACQVFAWVIKIPLHRDHQSTKKEDLKIIPFRSPTSAYVSTAKHQKCQDHEKNLTSGVHAKFRTQFKILIVQLHLGLCFFAPQYSIFNLDLVLWKEGETDSWWESLKEDDDGKHK